MYEKIIKKIGISGSTLKILACLIMLIDHSAKAILLYGVMKLDSVKGNPELYNHLLTIYHVLRKVGRPAFPIFCFLLVEGFYHTRNTWKYARNLFVFALLSELPFNFGLYQTWFSPEHQNVYFTLLIGVIVMILVQEHQDNFYLQVIIILAGMNIANKLHTDYGWKGIAMILTLYYFQMVRSMQLLAGMITCCWEMPAPLAYLPIALYNGKRGINIKYFFYLFYPLHLFVLGVLSCFIIPNFFH